MESRILGKILKSNTSEYKLGSNRELCQHRKKNYTWKRRLLFYGYIYRMNENRLTTKQILNNIIKYKWKPTWVKEIKNAWEHFKFINAHSLSDRTLKT